MTDKPPLRRRLSDHRGGPAAGGDCRVGTYEPSGGVDYALARAMGYSDMNPDDEDWQ